jgi:hypothetical protein
MLLLVLALIPALAMCFVLGFLNVQNSFLKKEGASKEEG